MGMPSGGWPKLGFARGGYTFPNNTSLELPIAILARPKAVLGSGSEATRLLGEARTRSYYIDGVDSSK